MSITCIIVEDEPLAQKLLEDYIAKVPTLSLQGIFTSPIEASIYLRDHTVDLIFLDIEMQDINGLEFLETLMYQPFIIFTTAFSQYAVESYNKDAVDYLLKPIKFERFLRAVHKIPKKEAQPKIAKDQEIQDFIYVKSDRQLVKLYFEDIYFIKSMQDYVVFTLAEKTYIVHHTLKKLEQLLPLQFQRAHYSYIVNLDKVQKLHDNHLYILNESIPIGNSYRELIVQQLKRWLI
ncbi:MAG: LytTR family DNA-binding domain-containing protein [Saprospiraceae bacterium]|nr:LytTR family DNA-binding domain-containing protein [Saprospiraceae bacterium]